MKYRILALLLACMMILPCTYASADQTEVTPYISLGANLSPEQKDKVLALLGVTEEDLSNYEVVQTTNKEEHEYLDEYLSASVIGTKALSSVRIERVAEGEGISVETKNINYCTSGMYTNALTTAGITDARVIVAGPFELSGTAALVGAMKAYGSMTGEVVQKDNADAATNELVLTGELAQTLGADNAEQLVALLKKKVIDGDLDSEDKILEAINRGADEMNLNLTEEQKSELVDLLKKIQGLDLDVDKITQQAEQVYNKLQDLGLSVENAKGFFDKIVEFFRSLAEKIASLFD